MRRAALVVACAAVLLGGGAAAEEVKLPAAPASVEEACDEAILARCQRATAAQATLLGLDVDQRAQRALAEERRIDRAPPSGRVTAHRVIVGALAGLGALLALAGLLRRRAAVGVVGVALLAAGLGLSSEIRRALGADGPDPAALVRLTRCRLMLADARAALGQTQLGTCLHNLSEVDEDLIVWEEKLRSGALKVEDMRHLRDEIRPR